MAREEPPAPLDTIYTADEAAERLRITTRAIIKLGRDIGACSRYGRTYLFSEADILDIWQAMRAPPISYHGRAVHIPADESPVNVARRLVELTAKKAASASPKARKLMLQRSSRPSAKRRLKDEFGED
ncbi:hypothetical protein [Chelativorans alearense]|uniref:hypothetical protein n=1 Tax=Chelativorans alearense TaxID=2681495 RepID=UPI0013D322C7|nr:hypothetical protein [Chelativorans alearense]